MARTIEFEVTDQVAEYLSEFSSEDRARVLIRVIDELQRVRTAEQLARVMALSQEYAAAQGLTDEILAEILSEP